MGKKPNATLQTHWSSICIRSIVCVCVFLRQNEKAERKNTMRDKHIVCLSKSACVFNKTRSCRNRRDYKWHFLIKCKLNRTGQRKTDQYGVLKRWNCPRTVLSSRCPLLQFSGEYAEGLNEVTQCFHKKRPKLDSDHGSHDTNSVFRGGRCSEDFLF